MVDKVIFFCAIDTPQITTQHHKDCSKQQSFNGENTHSHHIYKPIIMSGEYHSERDSVPNFSVDCLDDLDTDLGSSGKRSAATHGESTAQLLSGYQSMPSDGSVFTDDEDFVNMFGRPVDSRRNDRKTSYWLIFKYIFCCCFAVRGKRDYQEMP